nr:uncharacterized protein LOC112006074 [Quercus suber]POE58859.1 hypothetical protein CFP56_01642 [Quercus suber]
MAVSLTRVPIFSKLHVHTTTTFYSLTKPIPITISRSFFFATNREDKKDPKREPTEKELKEVVGFLAWAKTPESLASMEAIAEGNRNNGLQMREMREMLKEAKIRMEAINEQSDATKRNAMEVVEKLRAIRDGGPSAGSP